MNKKIFDEYSTGHFIIAFVFGYLFIEIFKYSVITLYGLLILFELFEHLLMGDYIFRWKDRKKREIIYNSIADILIGILAVLLASIMQNIF